MAKMKLPNPRSVLPGSKTNQRPRSGSGGSANQSVQSWLPVRDVRDGLLVRADGSSVAAFRVDPAPFTLLSERERERRISGLHEALQALAGGAQIAVVPRPLDLDAYLANLESLLMEADGARRGLLRNYLAYVRGLVTSAGALERRFYVLLAGEPRTTSDELLQQARELVAALGRAELSAHLCDERELIDLLFVFAHPAQAAFERAELPVVAPLYVKGGSVDGSA